MIFGLKKIPHRLIFMSYDDVETPTALIGKKLAPILHLQGEDPMPESLDIIQRVDEDLMLRYAQRELSFDTFCWSSCHMLPLQNDPKACNLYQFIVSFLDMDASQDRCTISFILGF